MGEFEKIVKYLSMVYVLQFKAIHVVKEVINVEFRFKNTNAN